MEGMAESRAADCLFRLPGSHLHKAGAAGAVRLCKINPGNVPANRLDEDRFGPHFGPPDSLKTF
ncbi:hypothetical protein CE91St47_28280 [Eubacteriales bacterium]|nr:hypothetical protein CE91St47_28280 [Eubacteriales bacterium]